MEFESQICTTIEQSERLLKLGIKKETADMHINLICGMRVNVAIAYSELCKVHKEYIKPAWSLHRLIELCGNSACDWVFRTDDHYTNCIHCIEWLIEKGYFNKEYLKGKL